MLVKIIADTLIKGVPVAASDEIMEVDAADGVILISACKAEKVIPIIEVVEEAPVEVVEEAPIAATGKKK